MKIDEETGEILEDNELKIDIAKNLETLNSMEELNNGLNNENNDLTTNPLLEKSEEFTTRINC